VTPDTGVPNDGITSSLSFTLYGTAAPNSTVSIYWGGSTTTSVTTTAAADGTWRSSTYTRTEYPPGSDYYEATATTSAGVSPRSAPFTLRLIPPPEVIWRASTWPAGTPVDDRLMYVSTWTTPLVAFSANGLPPGWTTTTGGRITGTTSAVGTYTINLSASNGAGTTSHLSLEMLKQLEALGLQMNNQKKQSGADDTLHGQTFLFTGTMNKLKRSDAEEMVEQHGGKLLSGVSSKLNYLVVGDDAGSKLEKNFRLLFSNTFKNQLNITLRFNRFGVKGFYLKQQTFTNNFYTSTNYTTKNNRFGFYSYKTGSLFFILSRMLKRKQRE